MGNPDPTALERQALRSVRQVAESMASGDFPPDVDQLRQKPLCDNEDVQLLTRALERISQSVELAMLRARKLTAIVEEINRGLRLEDVLDQIYDTLKGTIPYNRIAFALIADDDQQVVARWMRTDSPQAQLSTGYKRPLDQGTLASVMASGRPRIINDTQAYLDLHPTSEPTRRMIDEGIRSSLTCPLRVLEQPVGFLFFSSARPDSYKEEHTEFFVLIAQQVAGILHKSRLYEELLETKKRLEEANQRLEVLAASDCLTGVYNRRRFEENLLYEWRRATRSMAPLSLLMVDIDRFKHCNDSHGHLAGDSVLRQIAQLLTGCLHRAGDSVSRYGGEEFAVLLAATPPEGAMCVAERLREAVQQGTTDRSNAPCGTITISVGVSTTLAVRGRDPKTLVAAADVALLRAKQIGRNRVCFCDPLAMTPFP